MSKKNMENVKKYEDNEKSYNSFKNNLGGRFTAIVNKKKEKIRNTELMYIQMRDQLRL
jgi:hypothetical protein